MAQIYSNFMSGTVTDNPLLLLSTIVNSAGFASLPTVAGSDFMWLTLDPEGVNGLPEIVKVTAHGAAATVVTVVRAQQSTAARIHPVSSTWAHAVTSTDLNDLPHQFFTGKGDSVWGAGAQQSARLAATGTDGLVIVSDATQATGSKWAQVGAAGITDGSVTAAKLAAGVQGIPSFANAAARDAFYPSPTAGLLCYLTTPGRYSVYTGSAWRDAGIASSQSTVRQYRATAATGANIGTGAGTTAVVWTLETADTDAMATPPFSTLTLTEGVWAITAQVGLQIITGAASAYSVYNSAGGASPYASLNVGGVNAVASQLINPSTGLNFMVSSQNITMYTAVSVTMPVAAGTPLIVNFVAPQAATVSGTVTLQLAGLLQATQVG